MLRNSLRCSLCLYIKLILHYKLFSLGAAFTYFKSLNDTAVRKKKDKAEQHKQLCRRQGRMREVKFVLFLVILLPLIVL